MSRRRVSLTERVIITDVVPTYRGPHGTLDAYVRIPDTHIMEIRRAVTLSCIRTQADFLAMMFIGWPTLKHAHPNAGLFEDETSGAQNWALAHRQVCEALAKAGDTPDLFTAYKNYDHAYVTQIYTRAVQSIWGAN